MQFHKMYGHIMLLSVHEYMCVVCLKELRPRFFRYYPRDCLGLPITIFRLWNFKLHTFFTFNQNQLCKTLFSYSFRHSFAIQILDTVRENKELLKLEFPVTSTKDVLLLGYS